MKRPPSVWITQTLLVIFGLIWFSTIVQNLLVLSRDQSAVSPLRVAIGGAILLAVVVFFFAAFLGLAKRRLYGKWLGVLSLVLLWVTIVYAQIRPPAGPIKRLEYNSTAELVGGAITSILISVGFLILIIRLAFNKRVAAFFERTA